MIFGHFFDGDDDREVSRLQEEVWQEALGIIVARCNEHARFARGVLNDIHHRDWGTVYTFDQRTLRSAHDLLAAAWRFRNDYRQPELPFEPGRPLDRVQPRWLDWLNKGAYIVGLTNSYVSVVPGARLNQRERLG